MSCLIGEFSFRLVFRFIGVGFVWGLLAAAAPAQTQPASWSDLRDQGQTALQGGRAEEAMRLFREAEKLAPDKVGVQIGIARAAAALGRTDEGLKALDRAAELNPGVRDDPEWKDLRQRLSQPAAAGAAGVQAALEELDRQIAAIPAGNAADAGALRAIRDRLAKEAKGEAMSALDRRQVEQQAEAAGKADPCAPESAEAINRFLATSEPLMYRHPDQLRFLALRARVALQGYRFEEAWATGRLLAAMGAERAEGEPTVLDALLALRDAGLDEWGRAKALADARRSLARQLADEAANAAEKIEDAALKDNQCSEIAVVQAKTGNVLAAKRTAALITDAGKRAYPLREIAIAQARAGDIAGAMQSAEGLTSDAREAVLQHVAEAQADAGDFEGAKKTTNSIANVNVRAHAQRAIGDSQARRGDLDGAWQTVEAISNHEVRAEACGNIASAQAAAGDIAGAKQLADRMADPKSRSQMYRAIALIQARAGDAAGAQSTFNTAEAAANQIAESAVKDMVLLSIVADRAESGDIAGAKTTAKQISGQSHRAGAYSRIGQAEAKRGDFTAALLTADGIQDADDKAALLRKIAHQQARQGEVRAASDTLTKAMLLIRDDDVLGTLEDLISDQAAMGDVEGAMRSIQQYVIVPDYIDQDDHAMHRWTQTLSFVSSSNPLSARLSREAEQLAVAERDLFERYYDYLSIASAQATSGDVAGARRNLAIARQMAPLALDLDMTRSEALRSIAELYAKIGDADQAAVAFRDARSVAERITEKYRAKELGRIVEAETRAVQAARAATLTKAKAAVSAMIAGGDVAGAVAHARCEGNAEIRSMALVAMLQDLTEQSHSSD